MATPIITHAKVSGKPQGTDSTRIYGNHWDANHVVTGLENVDNTSDMNKPVSTAQAAADALRAPLASPALTGAPTAPTPAALNNSTVLATTAYVDRTTREKLSANRTYYVSISVGSDSNTGLAAGAGNAFLTIQKAIDVISNLDIQTYTVTIQVANGTYAAGCIVIGAWFGAGTVILQGDTTTPGNVIIATTSVNAVVVQNGGRLTVQGFKFTNTAAVAHLNAATFSTILFGFCDFGTSANFHIFGQTCAVITAANDYAITAGAGQSHATAGNAGLVRIQTPVAVTITGSPVFPIGFVSASSCGIIISNGISSFATATVGATTPRYSAIMNGVIQTGGSGATYFPGTTAGVTSTGGQYA